MSRRLWGGHTHSSVTAQCRGCTSREQGRNLQLSLRQALPPLSLPSGACARSPRSLSSLSLLLSLYWNRLVSALDCIPLFLILVFLNVFVCCLWLKSTSFLYFGRKENEKKRKKENACHPLPFILIQTLWGCQTRIAPFLSGPFWFSASSLATAQILFFSFFFSSSSSKLGHSACLLVGTKKHAQKQS